jgi:hypothetical protein
MMATPILQIAINKELDGVSFNHGAKFEGSICGAF